MGITLKVGGRYAVRSGGTARVISRISDTGSYEALLTFPRFETEKTAFYGVDGSARGGAVNLDLVAEIYDGIAAQFIRLWNCGLIAIPSANGWGFDVLRHYADGARMEATYPTLREALRCAH